MSQSKSKGVYLLFSQYLVQRIEGFNGLNNKDLLIKSALKIRLCRKEAALSSYKMYSYLMGNNTSSTLISITYKTYYLSVRYT